MSGAPRKGQTTNDCDPVKLLDAEVLWLSNVLGPRTYDIGRVGGCINQVSRQLKTFVTSTKLTYSVDVVNDVCMFVKVVTLRARIQVYCK